MKKSLQGKLGIALRPSVFSAEEMKWIVEKCDGNYSQVTHVFIPDIFTNLEPLELSLWLLSSSKKVKIGSGVIRILEHDTPQLARRILTIQKLTENRFIVGVGLGRPVGNIGVAINDMFESIKQLESRLKENMPETFVAALKYRLAKRATNRGLSPLLNFCSSSYAKKLIKRIDGNSGVDFACYIKVFYSESEAKAIANTVREFASYNKIPQYHELFRLMNVDKEIELMSRESFEKRKLPHSLLEICLVNPSFKELAESISRMRDAGVSLPVIYPYFDENDTAEFRSRKLEEIIKNMS